MCLLFVCACLLCVLCLFVKHVYAALTVLQAKHDSGSMETRSLVRVSVGVGVVLCVLCRCLFEKCQ